MPSADIPDFLRGGGETGARIAAYDWASTSLGPIAQWPPSLKTAVALVVHSAVPLVMLWGEDGVMIYNDAYSVFAGRRHPQLLGSKVREGWPEVADFNDNVMKAGLSGRTLAYRDQKLTLYRHGAPEPVWMNLDYSPVLDESGRPAGVIAIVVETTKRVQADQRIAAEQDRLLSLFDQAPGFMAMLDGPELVFTLANPAYLRLIGHRPAMGRRLRDVLPELRGQGFYEILEHCYRSGEPFVGNSLKVSLQPVQGGPFEDRFVDFVFQPVRDGAGAVTGIFVQGSEVTERVKGEIALRRLTETLEARVEERTAELAAANRQLVGQIEERERVEATLRQMQRLEAVGQLTSGVAHDFNNLLTVVLGNLGFIDKALVAAGVDDKSRNRLANIRAAAERGATLTAQLLAFSRKQRLEARAVDLNETLAKMQRSAAQLDGRLGAAGTGAAAGIVAGAGRSDPDRTGDPQSGDQRPRRHAGRRLADGGNRQCPAGGAEPAGNAGRRRICHDRGERHRHRHDARGAGQGVRAVLHHQAGRQGLGPRARPGVRLRQAIRRRRSDRQPIRRGHHGEGVFAARHRASKPRRVTGRAPRGGAGTVRRGAARAAGR